MTFGEKRITAYCDRWSARPGETLRFMVNCETDEYRADVVRLVCGDLNPDGPGYEEHEVDTGADGTYPGREQALRTGSHVRVDADGAFALPAFTVGAFVSPTTPGKADQGILTRWDDAGSDRDGDEDGDETAGDGYGLFLDDGEFLLRVGGESVRGGSVDEDAWYAVAGSYDPDAGEARLAWRALPESDRAVPDPDAEREGVVEAAIGSGAATGADADRPLVIAGYGDPVGGHYNGRLEAPRVAGRARPDPLSLLAGDPSDREALVAAWDFSAGIGDDGIAAPDRVTDVGPDGLDGTVVNVPSRAIPGHDWSRDVHDFTAAPDEFGAIHFHDDDLADARWDVDFELEVEDLDSAVYAVRLRTDAWDGSAYDPTNEYYVPFYVLPPAGESTADVLFLAPTNSYLAYANNHMKVDGEVGGNGREPVFESGHAFLAEHREYGLSTYDTHADGSGSMFSSRRRPLITVAPKYVRGGAPPSHLHQFNADLYLVDWLEAEGYDYDVATDEDLQREGAALLERYNVVLTGHHPEYYSREQFEAIDAYQRSGGRLMYLGGNGFYWVIGYHPDRPGIIEVRRGENGSESWVPKPGEKYHGFTGEKGGLWRERGWPPNRLVGIGTSGMWEPVCTGYRRQPDSYDPATEFVFEGVEGETFGEFGLLGGGAAGQEIDRYDTSWGSPEHASLLASSEGHTEHERRVVEELPGNEPFTDGRMDPKVRADVVYYRTPNEGAVFTTGSMAWLGSLSHDDYDNDVSRITGNVLAAFASDGPLPGSGGDGGGAGDGE